MNAFESSTCYLFRRVTIDDGHSSPGGLVKRSGIADDGLAGEDERIGKSYSVKLMAGSSGGVSRWYYSQTLVQYRYLVKKVQIHVLEICG
jgi:hypothetical protein